jgi:hypothetical protein
MQNDFELQYRHARRKSRSMKSTASSALSLRTRLPHVPVNQFANDLSGRAERGSLALALPAMRG